MTKKKRTFSVVIFLLWEFRMGDGFVLLFGGAGKGDYVWIRIRAVSSKRTCLPR